MEVHMDEHWMYENAAGPTIFPRTRWTEVQTLRDCTADEERNNLKDSFIREYGEPLFGFASTFLGNYVGFFGDPKKEAQDQVQEFIKKTFLRDRFWFKPDQAHGTFRSYLITGLKNHLINFMQRDYEPDHPLDAPQDDDYAGRIEPATYVMPDTVLDHIWNTAQLRRALGCLELICNQFGYQNRLQAFKDRVLNPLFNGTRRPPVRQLAERMNVPEHEINRWINWCMKSLQKFLCQNINGYDTSEDAEQEVSELVNEFFPELPIEDLS
jgi:DNA-directed RNA polymerase specialized sigma24 family protein